MKTAVLISAIWMSLCLKAQELPYDILQVGPHKIGFTDTLVFNNAKTYEGFGYSGASPLFIKMWFPLGDENQGSFLPYSAFRSASFPAELSQAHAALLEQMGEIFIQYYLSETAVTYEPLDFAPFSATDVALAIQGRASRSIRASCPLGKGYPVIVYHHGSQGMPDENVLMAEYFASRGYIFISVNFHLPYPGKPYGLTESLDKNTSSERAVLDFAGRLSPGAPLYFIGHSWGAQVGWTFLHEYSGVDAFVSLETTIEWKTDTLEINDKWPFVYEVVHRLKPRYEMPILMLAFTDSDRPFTFFESVDAETLYQGGARSFIDHEAYTSSYFLRSFLSDSFSQPDTAELNRQFRIYCDHLDLIDAFLESSRTNQPFAFESFEESFYVREIHKEIPQK